MFDSSRVVSLPLPLSLFLYVLFSFNLASSYAFVVKGEVAGGDKSANGRGAALEHRRK